MCPGAPWIILILTGTGDDTIIFMYLLCEETEVQRGSVTSPGSPSQEVPPSGSLRSEGGVSWEGVSQAPPPVSPFVSYTR